MIIYKYPLDPGPQVIFLPKDAQILDVQVQHEEVQMWVLLDNKAPKVKRVFETVPTGMDLDDRKRTYLSTFQLHGGRLIFHAFELESI